MPYLQCLSSTTASFPFPPVRNRGTRCYLLRTTAGLERVALWGHLLSRNEYSSACPHGRQGKHTTLGRNRRKACVTCACLSPLHSVLVAKLEVRMGLLLQGRKIITVCFTALQRCHAPPRCRSCFLLAVAGWLTQDGVALVGLMQLKMSCIKFACWREKKQTKKTLLRLSWVRKTEL